MGRTPCCEKAGLKRGKWTAEEDQKLINYIKSNGDGSWRSLPKNAGLLRCGKSCRLRWINYLREDVKRGNFTEDEEEAIVKLHRNFGNKWALIASQLPGRTDNEIKNYWNSHLSRSSYRFRSIGESAILTTPDMIKKRTGRVSRFLAKKYTNNTDSVITADKTTKHDKSSTSMVQQQATRPDEKVESCEMVREKDTDPLDSHESNVVTKSANEHGSFSSCDLLTSDPDAFMLSPTEGREMEILGPWKDVEEDSMLMHLKDFQDGENIMTNDGTYEMLMNMESMTANEERDCGAWSSISTITEDGNFYGCSSPILSYFNDEDFHMDFHGDRNELSFWSEGEDMIIW